MKKIIFLLLLSINTAYSQPGCTDPQAMNYDPTATSNDGSCVYPPTNLSLSLKTNLKMPELTESSGLLMLNDQLWSHVDNGSSTLYELDSLTPSIHDSIIISSGNQDWEDMASSDSFIYIGDFGNNFGNRLNLHILRFPSSSLGSVASVVPDTINFSYADQTNFSSSLNNHSFDCEAFFYYHDSLHLFSKDWVNKWTKHYVVPAVPGTYSVSPIDSMDATCLITSADIVNDSLVVLLGYNLTGGSSGFLWMLNDFRAGEFFSGNKRRFSLGSLLTIGQVEGIEIGGDNKGYITNEFFAGFVQPQLKSFDLNPYLAIITSVKNNTTPRVKYQSVVSDYLQLETSTNQEFQLIIFSASGQVVLKSSLKESASIYIGNLDDGQYHCSMYHHNRIIDSFSFIKSK